MRAMILAIALLLLAGSAAGLGMLTVTKLRVAVMDQPKFWGKARGYVCRLDKVKVLDEKGPWLKVSLPSGGCEAAVATTGYLHSGSFKDLELGAVSSGRQSGPSAEARDKSLALAARGFSAEVEKDFKGKHADLRPAYELLDRYEGWWEKSGQSEMAGFVAEGRLLGEGGP